MLLEDSEFSVMLPDDSYALAVDLCHKNHWSHRDLIYALVINSPPAEGREEPPPPPVKRSDCTQRFAAKVDAYCRKRLEQIGGWTGLSRRDMMIFLLNHYQTKKSKEIQNG